MTIKFKQILKQNPDQIMMHTTKINKWVQNGYLKFFDQNNGVYVYEFDLLFQGIPFCFVDGITYIGNVGDFHADIRSLYGLPRNDKQISGRIHKQSQIISFWKFPPKQILDVIIKDIKKNHIIKNTNDCMIQVYPKQGVDVYSLWNRNKNKWYITSNIGYEPDYYDTDVYDSIYQKHKVNIQGLLIPFHDLNKVYNYLQVHQISDKVKRALMNHTLSPIEKVKLKNKVYQKTKTLPQNMSTAEYKNTKTRYTFTQQRGYDGYSKSNNAISAQQNDIYPLTILAKKLKVKPQAIKTLVQPSQWHHTSKYYNKTNYYDGHKLIILVNDNLKYTPDNWEDQDDYEQTLQLYNKLKNFKTQKKDNYKSFTADVQYNIYTGTPKNFKIKKYKFNDIVVDQKGQFYYFHINDDQIIKKKKDSNGTIVRNRRSLTQSLYSHTLPKKIKVYRSGNIEQCKMVNSYGNLGSGYYFASSEDIAKTFVNKNHEKVYPYLICGNFIWHNTIISTDKILQLCKELNINVDDDDFDGDERIDTVYSDYICPILSGEMRQEQLAKVIKRVLDIDGIVAPYRNGSQYLVFSTKAIQPLGIFQSKKIVESADSSVQKYCKIKNLNYDQLSYLGKGDNGQAYFIDGKVLKLTTSKSQVYFNYLLLTNNNNDIQHIAQVYDITKIDYRYAILKQYLKQNNYIQNTFDILSILNVDVSQLNYFDAQDIQDQQLKSDYYEMQDYIDQIRFMYNECRELGLNVPDISQYNVGVDNNGTLKLMDLDDKRGHWNNYDLKEIPSINEMD